jgi:hypothetical protein
MWRPTTPKKSKLKINYCQFLTPWIFGEQIFEIDEEDF